MRHPWEQGLLQRQWSKTGGGGHFSRDLNAKKELPAWEGLAVKGRTEPVCKSTRKPQRGWEMSSGRSQGQASGCLEGYSQEYAFYSRGQTKPLEGLCLGVIV